MILALMLTVSLPVERSTDVIGTAMACDKNRCEQFEQRFPNMSSCNVMIQQSMAMWIGNLPDNFELKPGWECHPVNQTRI